MRDRAALMRTVLLDRDLLLLDEPFGALDAITRSEMQAWLLNIWDDIRRTVLFITHDVDEAVYLSDRVLVLDGPPGRIVADVHVPIPRPRAHDEVVTSAEFAGDKAPTPRGHRPAGSAVTLTETSPVDQGWPESTRPVDRADGAAGGPARPSQPQCRRPHC